jgi:hypothetical protein
MAAGESATAIARDLNIRCKFLYAWRAEGRGSNAVHRERKAAAEVDKDPHEQEVARLKARIAELERFNGKQAAELDFFVAALRNIKGTRPSNAASSAKRSTK